jgi:flagellar biosynthetic protein FlhB
MADEQEKSFEPTDHKIEESRKKGDIPKSQEINSFAVLALGTIFLIFNFSLISDNVLSIFQSTFQFNSFFKMGELDIDNLKFLVGNISTSVALILLPLMGAIFLIAIVANVSQFGFLANPLKVDFSKMNPISGFKQLFTIKKVIDFWKMLIKFIILLFILFYIIYLDIKEIGNIMFFNLNDAFMGFFYYVNKILIVALTIIGVFAIIDLIVVRRTYFKKLMMSMQEMKDEYKNMEGNPEIKQKIKEMQRKMSQRESFKDVSTAKVVITNPTHYAVAISQEVNENGKELGDPVIIAMGTDENAFKIKQIALEHNIEIIENKPLARALYASGTVGQTIPEELMQAIFDILIELDYIQEYIKNRKKEKNN